MKASRARQILAGAIVAEGVMDVLGLGRLAVCPWALREGHFLNRLDALIEGRDPDAFPEHSPVVLRDVHLRAVP